MDRSTWPGPHRDGCPERRRVFGEGAARVPGRRWPHFEHCRVVARATSGRRSGRRRDGQSGDGSKTENLLPACKQFSELFACRKQIFFLGERPTQRLPVRARRAGARQEHALRQQVPEPSSQRRPLHRCRAPHSRRPASPRSRVTSVRASRVGCSAMDAFPPLGRVFATLQRLHPGARSAAGPAQESEVRLRRHPDMEPGRQNGHLGGCLAHQRRSQGFGHEPPQNADGAWPAATRRHTAGPPVNVLARGTSSGLRRTGRGSPGACPATARASPGPGCPRRRPSASRPGT